jgi:hypothetical protein
MKAERWICALWAFVLAFAAAFGGVGGLVSGLGLQENMLLLALVLGIIAYDKLLDGAVFVVKKALDKSKFVQ